ncbi:MAG TPA: LCP family protein [Actinomycetota bacterium]|nr:LCP family protein [Actinomycetota bacterium]
MTDPTSPDRRWHEHPHLRRAFLAGAASIAVLVTVLSSTAFGLYWYTAKKIHTIGPESPAPSGASPTPAPITGRCAKTACNYLLLGSDSRTGLSKEEQTAFGTNKDIGGSQRSDTIIVVHVEPDQKKAVFLSFPRDLWVDIPGHGQNKINAAFEGGIEHGGAQLVARTVTALTGLEIDHVMYVDLAGFQGVVDALGGVVMCVPYPMQDPLTALDISAGCQHFNGQTALAYVRTRHQPCDTIPDFARISRQQQFLRAVIAKLLSPREIFRLPSLVGPILDSIRVDQGLNPAELTYLAGQLNGVNTGNVDFRVVPTVPTGTYVNGQYLSIVKLVQPQADQLFERLRKGRALGKLGIAQDQTAPSPAVIQVGVFDKRSQGAAVSVHSTLTQGGFDTSTPVQDVSVLVRLPAKGSVILFNPNAPDGQAMADVVHGYLSNLDEQAAPKHLLQGLDVAVIVGPNYTVPPPNTSGPVNCP